VQGTFQSLGHDWQGVRSPQRERERGKGGKEGGKGPPLTRGSHGKTRPLPPITVKCKKKSRRYSHSPPFLELPSRNRKREGKGGNGPAGRQGEKGKKGEGERKHSSTTIKKGKTHAYPFELKVSREKRERGEKSSGGKEKKRD